MRTRPWYRAWPETAALLFGIAWIPLLPRRAVVALSRWFGDLGFLFSKELRGVALANLEIAFGDELYPEERLEVVRNCFRHFALLVLDIIWFSIRTRQRLGKWVRWHGSTDVMFQEGAQIMLTAHYGNWETLGQAYAAKGAPIFSVAAPLKNRSADKIFIHMRQKTGQVIIPQKGAARHLLQGLRNGKKLAVLLDQNTRPRDGGIFVDIFGLPAPVSSAPGALAVKTGAPVCTVVAVPDRKGTYTVKVHEVLHADPEAADPVQDLTRRMSDSIVGVIRSEPEYWCWMYKRWRFIPDDQPYGAYPAYARRMQPGDFQYGAS